MTTKIHVEATITRPDGKTVVIEVNPEAVILRNGHVVFVDVPKGYGLEGGAVEDVEVVHRLNSKERGG